MRHVFRFLGRPTEEDRWILTDEENHHLSKVLRLEVGDTVEACDGEGLWASCLIETIGKNETTLRVVRSNAGSLSVHQESPPKLRIVLCIGALKPGSFDEILPHLIELGVDAIHLFHQPGSAKSRLADKAALRWDRLIHQSVKQCKRSWIPQVKTHDDLQTLLQITALSGKDRKFYLSPEGSSSLFDALMSEPQNMRDREVCCVCLVVGGEQGLSASEEATLAGAAFKGVRLGRHILRAVTAAISATAVVSSYRDRDVSSIVLE